MTTDKVYTVRDMIAYCERFIASLEKEEDKEPWMFDAIAIEKAIIDKLRGPIGQVNKPDEPFNEDLIGQAILKQVSLENDINRIHDMITGAESKHSVESMRKSLTEKREELKETIEHVKELRLKHRGSLFKLILRLEADIHDSDNAFDIQEMEALKRDAYRKIAIIDKAIAIKPQA